MQESWRKTFQIQNKKIRINTMQRSERKLPKRTWYNLENRLDLGALIDRQSRCLGEWKGENRFSHFHSQFKVEEEEERHRTVGRLVVSPLTVPACFRLKVKLVEANAEMAASN